MDRAAEIASTWASVEFEAHDVDRAQYEEIKRSSMLFLKDYLAMRHGELVSLKLSKLPNMGTL